MLRGGILSRAPTPQEEIESCSSLDLAPSVAAIALHVRRVKQAAIQAGGQSPYGPGSYLETPHPWDAVYYPRWIKSQNKLSV